MQDKTSDKTMNEPIKDLKFLAWHKNLEEIFEVHSLYYSGGTLICVDLVKNGFVEDEYVDVDDVVISQYTNMNDKNNKELYEHDVVEIDEHYDDCDNFYPKCLCVIRMNEGCLGLYMFDDYNKHIDKQYYLSGLHTHIINKRVKHVMNLNEYLESKKIIKSLAKTDD